MTQPDLTPDQWLDTLEANRPRGVMIVTQELLNATGSPPAPTVIPGLTGSYQFAALTKRLTYLKTVAGLAMVRADEAYARGKRLDEVGDAAGAQQYIEEYVFWKHVHDWADLLE